MCRKGTNYFGGPHYACDDHHETLKGRFVFSPQIIETAIPQFEGKGRIGDFHETKHLRETKCQRILEYNHELMIFD